MTEVILKKAAFCVRFLCFGAKNIAVAAVFGASGGNRIKNKQSILYSLVSPFDICDRLSANITVDDVRSIWQDRFL